MNEYLIFLLKTVTLISLLVFCVVLISRLRKQKKKAPPSSGIVVDDLGMLYAASAQRIKSHVITNNEQIAQVEANTPESKNNIFVLTFVDDSKAGSLESLKIEVSSILMVAQKGDQVIVKIKSHGGIIESYGCAAMQLKRLKDAAIHLTVSIDEVAASAAYLMASVADRIIASRFATIGSIGMISTQPNFHRLLEKIGVDYKILSSGDNKESLSMFGKPTEQQIDKLEKQLSSGHTLFKKAIAEHRPMIDVESVCQGDVWFGDTAIDVGLIDEIKLFDDLILEHICTSKILSVRFTKSTSVKSNLLMKLTNFIKPLING
ncbi:protease SohB [Colwellia sp. 6M3]|uniref:protease SohB n=1 Tax=Colwellia sp. 6M3 TaxID=2759849 RepID=UPI0015F3802B|nr:protease SohB [Colwellia sp. 6M3]MBA6417588.1 protease SohB [Colwellia sp. 6M3]|tara:strand:- start:20948 stop:21904 length:957 start_codon:yes stop_codon:yes gene_type:complete